MDLRFLVKVVSTITIFFFLTQATFAQNSKLEQTISIEFKDISIAEALEKISDAVAIKFAFDKNFFSSKQVITATYNKKKVRDIISSTIGSKYDFEFIGKEHIAIFNVKERQQALALKKNQKTNPSKLNTQNRLYQSKKSDRQLTDKEILSLIYQARNIRDSIRFVNYTINDTSRVIYVDSLHIQVNDTIYVHDTLSVKPVGKFRPRNGWYFSPSVSIGKIRSIGTTTDHNKTYGLDGTNQQANVYLGYEYRDFYLTTGIGLSLINSALSKKNVQNQTVVNSDTLDTFFEVINGEEIPVHIIENDTFSIPFSSEINRTNALLLLKIPVNIGWSKYLGNLKTGISTGLSASIPIMNETYFFKEGTFLEKAQFNNVLVQWSISMSLQYEFRSKAFGFISPFYERGINSIYPSPFTERSTLANYGINLGLRFYL